MMPLGYPILGTKWERTDVPGIWEVHQVGDTMSLGETPVSAHRHDGTGLWTGTVAEFNDLFRRHSE